MIVNKFNLKFYIIICFLPNINGDIRNRSNTLQVTKHPTTHTSNEINKKSKRVESKDKNGIKTLQHIVNIGEKMYNGNEFRPKNRNTSFAFPGI